MSAKAIAEDCDRIRRLAEKIHAAREKLQEIVETDGIDAGVILKDNTSPSHYDPETKAHVYEHEYFSELGDALMELWEILK